MSLHSSMTERLAQEHIAELRGTRRHQHQPPRTGKPAAFSVRVRSGRLLIALGTRLASDEVRANNSWNQARR